MLRMRRHESGIVAVVVAVAMLVLLLMAGLAIDVGHLFLNKSRLQSTVDAAALAGAKVLADSQSVEAADAAARQMFDLNAAKHGELYEVLRGKGIIVEFSKSLKPFEPGTSPPEYVRVVAPNFSMWTSFTVLIGFDEMVTRASAVAGPVPTCEMWPVGVCAKPSSAAPNWGHMPYGQAGNTVTLLKWTAASGSEFGPGNFQLLALPESMGKRDARQNLRAGVACIDLGGKVTTEPGNAVMIREGVNSRFYPPSRRGSVHLPDLVARPNDQSNLPLASADGTSITHDEEPITGIGDVDFSYVDYLAAYAASDYDYPYPRGRAHRRVVTVPVIRAAQCGEIHGRRTVDVVGYARYLLLQPVCTPGNCPQGTEGWIYAQFLGEGQVSGAGMSGPYRIVLHNDPDSPDS